jgi:hypothetical protein
MPEAKVYAARANETGVAKAGLKKPRTRVAAAQTTAPTTLASGPGASALRTRQPPVSRVAPAPNGWFSTITSGWATTVAPPPRLRRSSTD